MPNVKKLQLSFAGGEVTPEFFGRIDDSKYQSGLSMCRNFIAKPQGPVENRPGFAFVHEVKDSSKRTRLIPFTYSTTQTMVIELGEGYFRFHTQGATLMTGPIEPYEVANDYAEDELFDIHYVQSADVLTLVHPNHPPHELRRLGPLIWDFQPVDFAPAIATPAAPTITVKGATTSKYTYTYVVTAVASDGVTETAASPSASGDGNLFETGCTVEVSWSAVVGAARYNVYKEQGGLFGYIGQTSGTMVVDDNIAPDMGKTPPIFDNAFSIAGQIDSVTVTAGGASYDTDPGGHLTAVLVNRSARYLDTPSSVVVDDPTGSGAVVTATYKDQRLGKGIGRVIDQITVVNGGQNYTNPTLRFVGGTLIGSSNNFTIKKTPQIKTTLKVTDVGGGSGAALEAVVAGGAIVGVNVINPGSGYFAPVVTVDEAAGGSGAVFGAPATAQTGDYPGAVSYFEQRRCFGGTPRKPQNIWMTKSGTETDMSYSLPVSDADRIAFRIAAREANTIQHIVPLSQLMILTGSAEWAVVPVNSDAITPSSVSVRPQSYVGSSNVQPIVINNTLLFCAARGGHVHELAYNWQANGFTNGDVSLRAPHLFDSQVIVDMALAKTPFPVVWFVNSIGQLLGLTYVPEQQIGAWHRHDTDGAFESCTVVAEGEEDVLYCIVRREVNGRSVRYVERMASRRLVEQNDAFFVDCGLTYSGAPATTISGLDHLEGKEVSILADGAVHPRQVVAEGAVTLEHAASTVQIGLPITADLATLPVSMQVDSAFGQARQKNVNQVWLRVYQSSGIFVGPSPDRLTEAKQRTNEPYGSPPALKSREIPIRISPAWSDGGQVYVRQADPLPLTVVSLTVEVSLGG